METNRTHIEIMDTTLRDGEQTSGVSFLPSEKLKIAKLLLEDLKIDRIEVASAKISDGEYKGVQLISEWANQNGYADRVEILGFVDTPNSVDWIVKAGGKVLNLLTKGSVNHLTHQLRKTSAEHIADAVAAVEYAHSQGLIVNVYLEDWSNGMVQDDSHIFEMVKALHKTGVKRFMLPDTLGILTSVQTTVFVDKMVNAFPNIHFDFHAHNDYDLAVGNILAAVESGVWGVHSTINGLGERAGNPSTASVIAALNDKTDKQLNIKEEHLFRVSKLVEQFSGVRIPTNKPVIGENVFTQTCGVHADGDNKNSLYFNDLLPERFGRKRKYALGKTSGKANILKNLQEIGVDLSIEEIKKVTDTVIRLGDKKEVVTKEDLPYIISDVLQNGSQMEDKIQIINYSMTSTMDLKSAASLKIEIHGKVYEETSNGHGQFDAFMNALKKIYKNFERDLPGLTDYWVSIPPGGRTDAFVETIITWDNGQEFKTRGLDSDQTISAVKATVRMLNLIENKMYNN